MPKKKEPMEEDITKINLEFDEGDENLNNAPAEEEFADEVVEMSADVPIRLVAVLGKKKMSLKDLLKLKVGEAINLERSPNEFVDLEVGQKVVARGELVEIDGKLGVRIIKMLK